MALHRGDIELADLSHETLSVEALRPERHFDLAQHVVTDLSPRSADRKSA